MNGNTVSPAEVRTVTLSPLNGAVETIPEQLEPHIIATEQAVEDLTNLAFSAFSGSLHVISEAVAIKKSPVYGGVFGRTIIGFIETIDEKDYADSENALKIIIRSITDKAYRRGQAEAMK